MTKEPNVKKQTLQIILGTLVVFAGLGCELVKNTGTTSSGDVGTPTTTPPDFTVAPGEDTQSSAPGDNQGGGDTIVISPPMIDEGLVLNDGAERIKEDSIQARFITLNRNQMRYAFGTSCQGAEFVRWQPLLTLPLPESERNKVVQVSVQYKDFDELIGPCYTQSIIHDAQGPDINFIEFPVPSSPEGSTAKIKFSVTDALSEVTEVSCKLNDLVRPCLKGTNEINITAMPIGEYNFEVRGKDELGNESAKSIQWSIVSTTKNLSQNVSVDNYRKVDILFVIDNSGSMQYEQQSMAQRTSNFLSILRGLDYQIGIVTTDPRATVNGNILATGDGRLLKIKNGATNQFMITSQQSETEAQDQLSQTLQRSETGSGSEQGIRAAYRLIERRNANETNAKNLIRDDAQFAVVLISDEDESDTQTKNIPENLLKLVSDTFSGQKRFSFNSIITRPDDKACRESYGYAYGVIFKKMAELTGGIVGDVCATDYAAQVQDVAQGIRDLLKTLTLECVPLVDRGITITHEGVAFNKTYRVEGVNLKFDEELLPGSYNVQYTCLK